VTRLLRLYRRGDGQPAPGRAHQPHRAGPVGVAPQSERGRGHRAPRFAAYRNRSTQP